MRKRRRPAKTRRDYVLRTRLDEELRGQIETAASAADEEVSYWAEAAFRQRLQRDSQKPSNR